ncbi:MAG TPA: hypothetical protein VF911_00920 [Thermoanaerobaculia bacterium]|jgi:hypothetical protein
MFICPIVYSDESMDGRCRVAPKSGCTGRSSGHASAGHRKRRRARRIWNVYAAPDGASDEAWRKKSDYMGKKTESMQRHNPGQQDWYFTGDC